VLVQDVGLPRYCDFDERPSLALETQKMPTPAVMSFHDNHAAQQSSP
jgi:hypothetical protein